MRGGVLVSKRRTRCAKRLGLWHRIRYIYVFPRAGDRASHVQENAGRWQRAAQPLRARPPSSKHFRRARARCAARENSLSDDVSSARAGGMCACVCLRRRRCAGLSRVAGGHLRWQRLRRALRRAAQVLLVRYAGRSSARVLSLYRRERRARTQVRE